MLNCIYCDLFHETNSSILLSQNGCDVNGQSYSGNTALHTACGRGQVEIVRLLLKSGADSSLKNYHNDTPVMVAKNKKVSKKSDWKGEKKWSIIQQTLLNYFFLQQFMVVHYCFWKESVQESSWPQRDDHDLLWISTFFSIIIGWKTPSVYLSYIRINANNCKTLLTQLRLGWQEEMTRAKKWKVNVHILPSRGQTWVVQRFLQQCLIDDLRMRYFSTLLLHSL